MLWFSIHLVLLFLEALNDLHSWPNPRFELLNLVVKNEFEFLEFLCLFDVLINLLLFIFDCFITLYKFIFHWLNGLFLSIWVSYLLVQVHVHLLDVHLMGLLFLLSMAVLIAYQGQLCLLFHTLVNFISQSILALFLEICNLLPGPVLDLLAIVLMLLNHLLNLLW